MLDKYIEAKLLRPEDVDGLTLIQMLSLTSKAVRELFDGKHLTYKEVLNLSAEHLLLFEFPEYREALKRGEEGLVELRLYFSPAVDKYIEDELLSLDVFGGLTFFQNMNLSSEVVRELFEGKHLTYEEVLNLSAEQLLVFERAPLIREEFRRGEVSLKLLFYPGIQKCVDAQILLLEDIDCLTDKQKFYLNTGRLETFWGCEWGDRKRDKADSIIKKVANGVEIRDNTWHLFFCATRKNSPFTALPDDIKCRIGGMTGNLNIHDSTQSEKIARRAVKKF